MPEPKTCAKCGAQTNPERVDKHGEGHFYVFPGFYSEEGVCENCIEIAEKEEQRIRWEKHLAKIRKNISDELGYCGVPRKYRQCSFENFIAPNQETAAAVAACKEYVERPEGGLFLYGSFGTGKTHLAVAVTRELLLQGKTGVRFVYVPLMMMEIRSAFSGNRNTSEASEIKPYCETGDGWHKPEGFRYLIMDDIGVEKNTEWVRQTIDTIIYERDANLLSTVMTSNLSPDEIAEKIDARISSRLVGMGKILPLIGPDYRISSRKKGRP